MTREKRTKKAHRAGFIVGPILMTRRGYGFVEAPEGDVYVSRRDTAGAMHRDIVAVRPSARRGREGRSGTVVRIVERSNTTLVGRYEQHGGIGIVVASDPRLRTDVFVQRKDAGGATDGDIVVVRLTVYPGRSTAAQGVVEEVLGRPDTPGIAIEVIIREHGLETEFGEAAHEAAAAVRLDVEEALAAESDREDIRDWFTITIDPVDARDFDDAITLERVDGHVRLGVHIADVSHYVPWDSAIDVDAQHRATSVYLVDRVLPMLPEKLSNDVCSLNPGEDRLSFSVVMDLDNDAVVQSCRLFPSVMRSDRRFNYDEVQVWLEGDAPFPDAESEQILREFARITAAIGRRRVARGGLDFESVEAKVRLAEDGTPIDVELRQRTQATNMIEEAMILANETVASHMSRAKAPMVYRIHEDPDPEALAQVAVILKEFDYPIQDIRGATPATFQRIIAFAHNRPEKLLINSLLLRAMERARYVDYLAPHFGLASPAYCHFTSPIRRYPDLIVHRLLKAQLRGELESDPLAVSMAGELEWLAEHSSVMEREAEAAENDSIRLKLCELMAEHVGEVFGGIVTGVQSFGVFVQLDNTAEGLLHVESMTDDYYRYDPEHFMLVGEETGKRLRLGQRVAVRVQSVSVGESRIDFEPA